MGIVQPPRSGYLPPCLHPTSDTLFTSSLPSATEMKALSLSLSPLPLTLHVEWLKMSVSDGFEEPCDYLASLKFVPRTPGCTFLLLSSQNSFLYFRELLRHLWGLGTIDLCLQVAHSFWTTSPVVSVLSLMLGAHHPLTGTGRNTSAQSPAHSSGIQLPVPLSVFSSLGSVRFLRLWTSVVQNWTNTDIDGKERSLFYLLNDHVDQL